MERRRQLDPSRPARGTAILRTVILVFAAAAISYASDEDDAEDLRRSADTQTLLERGAAAFREKNYPEAARWLRRALRSNPTDEYTITFLGTVYFLQGNVDATLKYWNRIDKPRIDGLHLPGGLRVDPVLLDHAFTFAAPGMLRLEDLATTRARIDGLGIFPGSRFELDARTDGGFDASLLAQERNGFGTGKVQTALSILRGLPYQAINPDYYNLRRSATNITSLLRWDAQKRRALVTLSGPWRGNPKRRYTITADGRDEHWELRDSTQSSDPSLGTFGLRRAALGAAITSLYGNWDWSAGAEFSYRNFGDASTALALPPELRLSGSQLKQSLHINRGLWKLPEYRFESAVHGSSDVGRLFIHDTGAFARFQAGASAKWLPGMKGDDYAIQSQVRAGKILGSVPFDELFILGLERDNDLLLRAHIGTRDGRKGSAPMGRNYFVANWEIDKNIYNDGLFNVKLSPFLDVGKITGLGARQWNFDTGIQAKVRVLGVGFTVLYGKDTRTGRNAFYLFASR